jgi:hypothetical protein
MSMPPLSVEEIYEQVIRSLSPAEQAQLLEKIARNLSQQIPRRRAARTLRLDVRARGCA